MKRLIAFSTVLFSLRIHPEGKPEADWLQEYFVRDRYETLQLGLSKLRKSR